MVVGGAYDVVGSMSRREEVSRGGSSAGSEAGVVVAVVAVVVVFVVSDVLSCSATMIATGAAPL